jgi:transcriptional regulator with AAA-type ATPase domain
MRFTYFEDVNHLTGINKAVFEQQEFWALNAILNFAKADLEQAAKLFGTSKAQFLERLEKHKLLQNEMNELLSLG